MWWTHTKAMAQTFLKETLRDLESQGLRRTLKALEGPQGPEIMIGGKRFLNFSSNDYLGLAADPRLLKAAVRGMERMGLGAGASRLVCGTFSAHTELEAALAHFKGTESALVFNAGYMANVGILPALFDRRDIIFSDRLNHASIIAVFF